MDLVNSFSVGDIVTFKTHPLLYDFKIKGDGKLVPPFMVVKEVFFEDYKKKIVDDSTGEIIAERIKYTCVFFDDNKSEFKDVVIYESMLASFKKFYIARIEDKIKEEEEHISLIDEVSKYTHAKYKYGNLVYFKTKKLEILKKRSSVKITKDLLYSDEGKIADKKKITAKEIDNHKEDKKGLVERKEITQYVVNYSTPEFILCGFKRELGTDLFYPNGKKKKIVSEILYKVKWFNSSQMKFSEQYLPMECFINEQPFPTIVPHNNNADT
tara:strand:+ start:24486 stop:25292 length:807 start_codon:yes stop_codon:yes gene_type:complete